MEHHQCEKKIPVAMKNIQELRKREEEAILARLRDTGLLQERRTRGGMSYYIPPDVRRWHKRPPLPPPNFPAIGSNRSKRQNFIHVGYEDYLHQQRERYNANRPERRDYFVKGTGVVQEEASRIKAEHDSYWETKMMRIVHRNVPESKPETGEK